MTSSTKRPLMDITARPEVPMVRGAGSRLWDGRGNEYLDFVQGWAVNCLGHSPQVIRDALARQSALLINASPAFHNEPQLALAAALVSRSVFDQVFFCNSGAEANEGAIKLARKWGKLHRGGAYEVLTTHDAFHGRTLATMAASGKPGWDEIFPPRMEGFRKLPYDDLDAMAAAVTDRTVAIMVEPIQGEAGVVVPSDGYLGGLRALCDRAGILLIADEVQTGVGRTGTLFGYEHAGIAPDIMTLGKGLGGGVPLAALLAREAVCCFAHGDQGGTFNGNPLMTAVGTAVFDVVSQPAFLEQVRARGQYLSAGLDRLRARHGGRLVRGRGLLQALDLGRDISSEVVLRCRERGLLVNGPRPQLLRLMPALNVSEAEVDEMLATLDAVLGELPRA